MIQKSNYLQLEHNQPSLTSSFPLTWLIAFQKDLVHGFIFANLRHKISQFQIRAAFFDIEKFDKQKMKIVRLFLFSIVFSGRVEKCNQVISVKQKRFFSFLQILVFGRERNKRRESSLSQNFNLQIAAFSSRQR